jgi:DNA (cytosine-5)-methyltransferase 1
MNEPDNRIRSLDLFSGYGGISLALENYTRPIMYCEIERYAQGILLSRMDDGTLPVAPIWNDVTSLDGTRLRGLVQLITAGFPCQDLSVAGAGKGLAGERSGLFYEIIRLAKEINPAFVFLENVPAIRTRGLLQVISAFREMGHDVRWTCQSASSTGAPHKRERWFLLSYNASHPDCARLWDESGRQSDRGWRSSNESGNNGKKGHMANTDLQGQCRQANATQEEDYQGVWKDNGWSMPPTSNGGNGENLPLSESIGVQGLWPSGIEESCSHDREGLSVCQSEGSYPAYWYACPEIHRVVDGPSVRPHQIEYVGNRLVDKRTKEAISEEDEERLFRAERIKACGNGVVPLQVKVAFERLLGVKNVPN